MLDAARVLVEHMVPSDHDSAVLLDVLVRATLPTGANKRNILRQIQTVKLTTSAQPGQVHQRAELFFAFHVYVDRRVEEHRFGRWPELFHPKHGAKRLAIVTSDHNGKIPIFERLVCMLL